MIYEGELIKMRKNSLLMINILVLLFSCSLSAKQATKGPVFNDYGPVFKIENRDVPLVKDTHYQIVFDVSKASSEPDKLNRRIESVARFINMHAMNGVSLDNMDIAVVLHGKATRDGLNHSAYKQRHKTINPTLDLIEQLSVKGVKFYQCGQSAEFYGIQKSEYIKPVKIALSAMTMLFQLQAEGYQILP